MREPRVSVRASSGAVVCAEVVAVVVLLGMAAAGLDLRWCIGTGVGVALLGCILAVCGAPVWQWIVRLVRWLRHRKQRLALPEFSDVDVDGTTLGVLIDGHTVVTMVSVWGKPYLPTLLKVDDVETPNTLPISVVASVMQQAGLGVDVDIHSQGRRTAGDSYSEAYSAFLRGRAAVGQRSTTLVVRLDTHAGDTTGGLLWRRDSVAAAAAATARIVKALRETGCRAEVLTASHIRDALGDTVGGSAAAAATYDVGWKALHQPGYGYTTSYFLSAKDLTAKGLANLWAYEAEHTAVVVALRRTDSGVRASAVVRYTTTNPITANTAPPLNRFTGRQWSALADAMPGANRLTGLPSVPADSELDGGVGVGSSGVLIGGIRDSMVLMPLSDPAQPTRVALRVQSDMAVRQFIRRAAATGEMVAVYDARGRWKMTSQSSRIWTTRTLDAQPPRPPTMVVHTGRRNPYPGAWISVAVDAPQAYEPDVTIEQDGNVIRVATQRFSVDLTAVAFRNEQPYLN